SLAAEDNQTVVYEMLPLWLFKKLAYSLPINNYVGLFPDYQDANRDYFRITDLKGENAVDELTKIGESSMENRVTSFVSGERIHMTMKVFARRRSDVEKMIADLFGLKGGKKWESGLRMEENPKTLLTE
ncbi:MAG: hypothetical protein K6G40_05635, partial [Eubacterium sp.]|nr:hypothetical protein [Eubacterium sp.]